jgi:iron complex outermembrane recepter protein
MLTSNANNQLFTRANFKSLSLRFVPPMLGLSLASPVFAQLEEIVVTAQKRAENLQEVPISISAFSEDFLADAGVSTTEELNFVTPGLNFTRQIVAAVPFIRGVGTDRTSAGNDSSVSTYVDGVYYSSASASVLSLNNIKRIEVLKGPQGTLFGRNATGGLIHVITKDPEQERSGKLELSYGNYDRAGVSFYGTTGISDNIATDLAVNFSDQGEGFGTNTVTGNDVNTTDELSLRNKWKIDISDNTTVNIAGDYSDIETSQGLAQRLAPGELGVDGLATFAGLTAPPPAGPGLTPAAAAPIAAAAATRFTGDFQDVNSSIDPMAEVEQWGVSVTVEHSFGDIDLVSVTAYRDSQVVQSFASDETPFPNLLDAVLDDNTETFTQEIRISSGTENFRWMTGVFILDEDAFYDTIELTGALLGGIDIVNYSLQETFSWSIFAQVDYDITDRTTVTAGLRHTEDERDLSGNVTAFAAGTDLALIPLDFEDSANFDELSWRLSLQHNFAEDVLGYVSYNRGFKSGVFNTIVGDPIGGHEAAVNPEIIDAYEVGLKTEFLDNRFRLNVAAFLYDFQDLQITVPTLAGQGAANFNAPSAEIKGAELELSAVVTESFSFHLGVSYLDTELEDFLNGPLLVPTGFGANTQILADLSGNNLARAPELTYSLGGEYRVNTSSGLIIASFNYYYNDGFFWDAGNTGLQEDYSVTNVHLTWESQDEKYSVRLYGNNIFDEEYASMGNYTSTGNFLAAAPPATFGVKVAINF